MTTTGDVTLFDAVTANSGGGTIESSKINVQGKEKIGIELVGDSNADDIDVISRATPVVNGTVRRHDVESSQDFTADPNNGRAYEFKVAPFSEVTIKLKNNTGSNIDFDGEALVV